MRKLIAENENLNQITDRGRNALEKLLVRTDYELLNSEFVDANLDADFVAFTPDGELAFIYCYEEHIDKEALEFGDWFMAPLTSDEHKQFQRDSLKFLSENHDEIGADYSVTCDRIALGIIAQDRAFVGHRKNVQITA